MVHPDHKLLLRREAADRGCELNGQRCEEHGGGRGGDCSVTAATTPTEPSFLANEGLLRFAQGVVAGNYRPLNPSNQLSVTTSAWRAVTSRSSITNCRPSALTP